MLKYIGSIPILYTIVYSIGTPIVVFILLYLVNKFVYPQSDQFPIIHGTRPFKTYIALAVYENPAGKSYLIIIKKSYHKEN